MEDFYINNTSLDKIYNNSNITSNYYNYGNITSNDHNYGNITSNDHNYGNNDYMEEADSIMYVVTYVIICIGLLLTLVAIYALYSLVRKDHVAPIYVISLLISDLIQLCCMIVWVTPLEDSMINQIFIFIYLWGLVSSVGFMVCVALERYLVIACPLWYRFRRTIKASVVVCVVVWALPLVILLPVYFRVDFEVTETIFAIFLLLPFPLLIFSLGGTLKALSAASSVPSDEKRRIVGILVLVLLIYTLLFMPSIILLLAEEAGENHTLSFLSLMFLELSPLADLILYVFMRKGAIDRLLASMCCCRMDSSEISSSTV